MIKIVFSVLLLQPQKYNYVKYQIIFIVLIVRLKYRRKIINNVNYVNIKDKKQKFSIRIVRNIGVTKIK